MTTTKATETKCTRCGRTLRSATSIADGMGRTCKSKVKAAAEVIDLTAFRDAKAAKDKAVELVEQAAIIPAGRPGLYLTPSADGANTYLIDTIEGTCTCKGHVYTGHCKHAVAAALIESRPTARFAKAA